MQTTLSIHEARQQLGEIINEAYYQDRPFVLTRGKKSMALLIGIKEFIRILKLLEKHDRPLAKRLSIMTSKELQKISIETD